MGGSLALVRVAGFTWNGWQPSAVYATPTQNSYVERFNRTYRDEILNMYVFRNLTEVRQRTESWMTEYNDERPHDSLEDLTPWEYLAKHQQAENSNQRCN